MLYRADQSVEAAQNARRARLANLIRFRDDIDWRFGHPSVIPAAAEAALAIRRRSGRPVEAYEAADTTQHWDSEDDWDSDGAMPRTP